MKLTAKQIFFVTLICAALGFAAWTFLAAGTKTNSRHGAPFNLVDDLGAPITDRALQSHPSLVFFGYTHCPEVCPTTLYEMAGWFKALGPAADGLKAYFFTVDPERDTPEIIHGYTSNFTDRVTGITGDPAEVQKVIKEWQIFVRKVPTADGDYTIDHTASVFMLDDQGRLKGTIAYGEEVNSALAKIQTLLKSAG
ncbi:SCO family protein [Phyllobacterium myrsinacearum]|uniref:SCO family protein n=1 Tax=Phyllobacterium myrsinacearum TaxID=28101 RepID=A0A2S9JP67_9HYPH|nr:SCO family protein [Phyllobacterium myrsinacearum]PRD55017.1 SCO family protein [Phyllobacterium myrsinacearum]PWV90430.1 protein SCO1/2 [Phyllobacterium myrsinacearum]RZS79829.1 protein SCO1/2 [Phyllobacterium myrsinacearum]RZV05376.1 protein SCO1/2 [Phyllobacterium myrsinacearum]